MRKDSQAEMVKWVACLGSW